MGTSGISALFNFTNNTRLHVICLATKDMILHQKFQTASKSVKGAKDMDIILWRGQFYPSGHRRRVIKTGHRMRVNDCAHQSFSCSRWEMNAAQIQRSSVSVRIMHVGLSKELTGRQSIKTVSIPSFESLVSRHKVNRPVIRLAICYSSRVSLANSCKSRTISDLRRTAICADWSTSLSQRFYARNCGSSTYIALLVTSSQRKLLPRQRTTSKSLCCLATA